MISTDYGPAGMLAFLGIYPDDLSLPALIAGRDLVEDQKSRLEELASKVRSMPGVTDLGRLIGEFDEAIRQRSIGSEASIIYDISYDAVYLKREGKLKLVRLTPTERAVLKYLMNHLGERLKPSSIADGAGLRDIINFSRYIKNIMQKLSDTDPHQPKYIRIEGETKNRTYMFIAPQNKSDAAQHHYISVPTPQ